MPTATVSDSHHSTRSDGSTLRAMQVLTWIGVALYMARGVTGPVSSLYARSLGASYLAIGLLGSVSSLAAVSFTYALGWVSDRIQRRKAFIVLALGTLVMVFGAMSIVPAYGYLYPLAIVGAVAQTTYDTTSLALIGDLLDKRARTRGHRTGIYRGLCSLGFGVMAFLAGSIADRFALTAPYRIAALCFAGAMVAALWIREPRRVIPERPIPPDGPKAMLSSEPLPRARLWLSPLAVAAFLWALVTGAVYAVWANYMVSELGYSQTMVGRLWAVAALTELPWMILAGALSDRIGRSTVMSLSFVAWSGVFAGYLLAPEMPGILIVQLLRGFAYGAFTAPAMAYATEMRERSERGRASGVYGTALGIGSIAGASSGGVLVELLGFRAMIAVNGLVIFAGALYLGWIAIRGSRKARVIA